MIEFNICLLLLVLNVSPMLQQAFDLLEVSTEKVTEASQNENEGNVTTPKSLNINDTIQQIDVKDGLDTVTTEVKQVNYNDSNVILRFNLEDKKLNNNTDINNETKGNVTSNVLLENTLDALANTTRLQSNDTTGSNEITNRMAFEEDYSDILSNSNGIGNKFNRNVQNPNVNGSEISWRIDSLKNKYQNVTNAQTNTDSDIESYITEPSVGDSKPNFTANDEDFQFIFAPNNEKGNVFVIINSGNIEGFSVNSPVANDNIEDESTKTNNIDERIDIRVNVESKLNDSKLNNITPKSLKRISKKFKNGFWILNSGDILNFRLNSPVLDTSEKDTLSKVRSKRNLNNVTEIIENVGNLKIPVIDSKFRNDEDGNKNQFQTSTSTVRVTVNNSSDELNSTDSINIQNNDSTKHKILEDKAVSRLDYDNTDKPMTSTEKANPDQDLRPTSSKSKPNLNNNNNNLLQPLSQLKRLGLGINNLDVIGNTIDFIKRLKRDVTDYEPSHWNEYEGIPMDDAEIFKKIDELCLSYNNYCLKYLLNPLDETYNGDVKTDNRIQEPLKRIEEEDYDEKQNNTFDIECPQSIIVKEELIKILNFITKSKHVVIATIYPIVSSLKTQVINLLNLTTLVDPFPVKIKVQLIPGDTKDFIQELSNHIDITVCRFPEIVAGRI